MDGLHNGGGEVIQLDERRLSGDRSDDNALLACLGLGENFSHCRTQLLDGAIRSIARLLLPFALHGESKAIRSHAGEGIQYIQRLTLR